MATSLGLIASLLSNGFYGVGSSARWFSRKQEPCKALNELSVSSLRTAYISMDFIEDDDVILTHEEYDALD
jgi:hypothetical protein